MRQLISSFIARKKKKRKEKKKKSKISLANVTKKQFNDSNNYKHSGKSDKNNNTKMTSNIKGNSSFTRSFKQNHM